MMEHLRFTKRCLTCSSSSQYRYAFSSHSGGGPCFHGDASGLLPKPSSYRAQGSLVPAEAAQPAILLDRFAVELSVAEGLGTQHCRPVRRRHNCALLVP